jgi:hypothetical protein
VHRSHLSHCSAPARDHPKIQLGSLAVVAKPAKTFPNSVEAAVPIDISVSWREMRGRSKLRYRALKKTRNCK